MIQPYADRLILIDEMLKSPHAKILDEAYDLLFNLWLEYLDKDDFNNNLKEISKKHPKIAQAFTDRINKSAHSEYEKIMFLKRIQLLEIVEMPESVFTDASQVIKQKANAGWSKRRIVAVVICGLLFAFGIGIYLKYVNPKNPPRTRFIPPNLILTYTSPKYISEEDENSVKVTLVNQDKDQPFSGRVTLVFSDRDVPIMPVPGKSLSMEVANLGPGDRKTEELTFTLPRASSEDTVDYYLRIFPADGLSLYQTADDEFLVSPFPRIWAVLVSLISVGGFGSLLVTFLWEKLLNLFKLLFNLGDVTKLI